MFTSYLISLLIVNGEIMDKIRKPMHVLLNSINQRTHQVKL
jgi:hypothetical protein